MTSLPVTQARSRLYQLLDEAAASHEPIQITGKRCNAVLVSEEDWRSIQETLRLVSIPGMRDSIRKGLAESLNKNSKYVDSLRIMGRPRMAFLRELFADEEPRPADYLDSDQIPFLADLARFSRLRRFRMKRSSSTFLSGGKATDMPKARASPSSTSNSARSWFFTRITA